jgi:peptidoglycan/xylan/chitin deacetylase (PgdA/CDA1 family)
MLLALAPVVPRVAARAGIPLRHGGNGVMLTFDDGPHPDGTPAVLELLDDARAKAVFFLVGEQVARFPGLAGEIVARGHALGVHCFRHRVQARLTHAAVEDDLRRALAVIPDPAFHRPPLGIYSRAGLDAARAAGLRPLLWSRWGRDWRKWTTPERIARRATRAPLRDGDVILLHDSDAYSARDSWRRTVAALPRILDALQPTGSASAAADWARTQS